MIGCMTIPELQWQIIKKFDHSIHSSSMHPLSPSQSTSRSSTAELVPVKSMSGSLHPGTPRGPATSKWWMLNKPFSMVDDGWWVVLSPLSKSPSMIPYIGDPPRTHKWCSTTESSRLNKFVDDRNLNINNPYFCPRQCKTFALQLQRWALKCLGSQTSKHPLSSDLVEQVDVLQTNNCGQPAIPSGCSKA